MTLASIIRAQLADGRPLRVTRALLEALDASEIGEAMVERREDDAGAGWRRYDEAHARSRLAAQRLIEHIGSIGPESVEQVAERAVAVILSKARVIDEVSAERDEARAEVERLRAALATVEARESAWRAREDVAEERGAQWAIDAAEALVRASAGRRMDRALLMPIGAPGRGRAEHGAEVAYTEAHSLSEMDAERICAEARKAGEHG